MTNIKNDTRLTFKSFNDFYRTVKVVTMYDNTYRGVVINGTGTLFFSDEENFHIELLKDKVLKSKHLVGVRYYYDTVDKGIENTGVFIIDLMSGLFLEDTGKWESVYGVVSDKYELREDGSVIKVIKG